MLGVATMAEGWREGRGRERERERQREKEREREGRCNVLKWRFRML